MSYDFSEYLDVLQEDEFEEKPVGIREFIESDQFLGLPPLSEIQYQLLAYMTQIYKYETLVKLFDDEERAKQRYRQTVREIIAELAKGCQAPYTPVYDANSGKWRRLDSFNLPNNLVVGVFNNKSEVQYATESFYEGSGKMVRVTTALGFVEDVHVGHKYLSYTKQNFYDRVRDLKRGKDKSSFKKVSDINIGDRIAVGLNYDVANPVNIPIEHAELIGFWVGDGAMPKDNCTSINVTFNKNEKESIARYIELLDNIGDAVNVYYKENKVDVYIKSPKKSNAWKLVEKYGLYGKYSYNKLIPDAIWKSDNNILAAFISKLWQTDGCLYWKTDKEKSSKLAAEFCTTSEQLAYDVHRALLRLSIPSKLRSRMPNTKFANFRTAYYVSVGSQECIDKFLSVINLLDHKNIKNIPAQRRPYARIDGDIYWDRIVSIEEIPDGDYWTITQPQTENYVGNGLISSNSGKNETSTSAVLYIIYQLLCLKDPARYYGKPSGDAIDIINVAINAEQARRNFFDRMKTKLEKSPWFEGKYKTTQIAIEFDKNISCYSGHSEREAFEGYNLFMCILDEIAGFAVESTSGNIQSKTAQALYDMYADSVDSRFPEFGKLILLSFPRYQGDFITKRYDEVVGLKEEIEFTHIFKLNNNLPDGTEGNEFEIKWIEDRIINYREPNVFAVKAPSWKVNPTVTLEGLKMAFYRSPVNALAKFCCMPDKAIDGFFKDHEKIETAFSNMHSPFLDGWVFKEDFVPDKTKQYYIHIDLGQKHDRASVALAHVSEWVKIVGFDQPGPVVIVDAVRYWTPTKEQEVKFAEVYNYVLSLRQRGFPIKLVTLDQWQSVQFMEDLKNAGISAERLSVALPHYEEFSLAIQDERIKGPYIPLLIEELKLLRVIKGNKVDHPRSGGKDISDSVCGAIYNAIANTSRNLDDPVVEVYLESPQELAMQERKREEQERLGIIRAPKAMPKEISDWLAEII